MTEYRIIEKRFYIRNEETNERKTLIEKVGYGNKPSNYKIKEHGKTRKLSSETYHNIYAKTQTPPEKLNIKTEKIKESGEYDEYDYFIGFDYESSSIKIKGKKEFGTHGKHDFKTEFRIKSPIKLNKNDIIALIQKKWSDYSNVWKNTEAFNIDEPKKNKVRERPSLDDIEMTEKITR